MTPWETFLKAVEQDPAAPRVTFYERTPGPTEGERIELSGKVLLNWASKAANLLVEEFDVEPGMRVSIRLPASHWRTAYWCLAAWAAGASVDFVDSDASAGNQASRETGEADVTVGTTGAVDVLVTLAALARSASGDVPPGALDEARDLSTYADQFVPIMPPHGDAEAVSGVDFATLGATTPAVRAYDAHPTPQQMFAGLIGGGIVLVRGESDQRALAPLLQQEGLQN